jgi:hypothetical protein
MTPKQTYGNFNLVFIKSFQFFLNNKILSILLLKFNTKRSAGCVIYELISLEKFSNNEQKHRQLNYKIPQQLIKLMKM